MTARGLDRSSSRDHAGHEGHEVGHAGHGRHHWMMLACCVPMIIIVAALVASGTISATWVLFAVACIGMMALMMRGMDHGAGHGGPER